VLVLQTAFGILSILMNSHTFAPVIGMLHTVGDAFSERRMEMLVGPMLLAGFVPMRFVAQHIEPEALTVSGQRFSHGVWHPCCAISPTCILDLSHPRTPRTKDEAALLAATPHTTRIDLDRRELLAMMQSDEEFSALILPTLALSCLDDFQAAASQWSRLVIKKRFEEAIDEPVLLERHTKAWLLTTFFQKFEMDDATLQAWLADKFDGSWMLQKYLPTQSVDGRAYALQITVQQRYDDAWMVPNIQCMIATDSPFACLSAGAEHIGTPFTPLWENRVIPTTSKAYEGLGSRLQAFGVALSRRIQELTAERPLALGFRVLLDADLNLFVANFTVRVAAPTRAARNLEFFKHMVECLHGLAERQNPKPQSDRQHPQDCPAKTLPPVGMSIRSLIKPEGISFLLQAAPAWIDTPLSMGGRKLLHDVQELPPHTRPFVSLRVGFAGSDAYQPELELPNILALVDYLGKGSLRLTEARFMRSIRPPLLQAQLDQAVALMPTMRPDLVWLEDIDLGLRGISADNRAAQLEETVKWFGKLCADGAAGAWGVSFFNSNAEDATTLVAQIAEIASSSRFFPVIGLRAAQLKPERWVAVAKKLTVVLLVNTQVELQWAREKMPDSPVLLNWSAVVQNGLSAGVAEATC